MFPLGTIIPTDELIFFRGVGQPPTSYKSSSLADGRRSPSPGALRSLLRFGPHRSAGSGRSSLEGFQSRAANRDMRIEQDHFTDFNRL